MPGRAAALALLTVLAAGCGDSRPAAAVALDDVRGTPFRVEPPKAPATPEPSAIGDLDGVPTAERALPVVVPTVVAPKPPPAPAASPSPPATAAAQAKDAWETVSFDDLAAFDMAAGSETSQPVPEKIRALSGRRVVIDGYMMPLKYEAGGAKKFLLMRYRFGCCYAVPPKINEWIEVTMDGGRVADYIPDMLVNAYGTLEVKEQSKDGMTTGLYTMSATRTEFTEAK